MSRDLKKVSLVVSGREDIPSRGNSECKGFEVRCARGAQRRAHSKIWIQEAWEMGGRGLLTTS